MDKSKSRIHEGKGEESKSISGFADLK